MPEVAEARAEAAEVLGEYGLVEAEQLAATAPDVPAGLFEAIVQALPSLGLHGGEHVLLDNCGPDVVRSDSLRGCDIAALERDWRLAETLGALERVSARAGDASNSAFPDDAFHVGIVSCGNDCGSSQEAAYNIHEAAKGLAGNGVLIATVHETFLQEFSDYRRDVMQELGGLSVIGQFVVHGDGGDHDVLVMRKKGADERQEFRWFGDRTDCVDIDVSADGPGWQALTEALAARLVQHVGDEGIGSKAEVHGPALALARPTQEDTLVYLADTSGGIWLCDRHGVAEEAAKAGTRKAGRMRGALELARLTDELLEREGSDEARAEEIDALIATLRDRYEQYVAAYGRLSDNGALREVSPVTHAGYVLLQLEEIDAHGRFAEEGAILHERVAFPIPDGLAHTDDPDTALSASMAQLGRVDLAHIAGLLGVSEPAALDALGDRVIADPDDGTLLLVEDYLSGNVGGKLDHVRELIAEETDGRKAEALHAWKVSRRLVTEAPAFRWPRARSVEARSDTRDALAYLTGQNKDIAVDIEARFQSDTVLYEYYHANQRRDFVWNVLREAREGAWDPVLSSGPREAMLWVVRSGISQGYLDDVPLAMLADFVDCKALDDAMYTDLVERIVRRRGADTLRSYVLAAYDLVEGHAARSIQEAAEEVVPTLRERPELMEWLLSCRDGDAVRDEEGFERFCRQREAALTMTLDDERLAELHRLEERLEQTLPRRIERKDIAARLGSPWIPASIYFDFVSEKIMDPLSEQRDRAAVSVTKDDDLGRWDIKASEAAISATARARYGITSDDANDVSALRLFGDAMRGIPTTVTRTIEENGERRQVVEEDLTLLAAEKRSLLETDFVDWLWKDSARAAAMEQRYNQMLNRYVGRHYDGAYLTMPGASGEVTLLPHQKDAVARILRSPEGSLIAHAVGAGKTFEGVAAVHEAKRMGKCDKPMVAVPNSVVGQWAREWSRVYPQDRVLVMDEHAAKNARTRARFWEAAQGGNWDAILVPQSQFDNVTLSPETKRDGLQARRESINQQLNHNEGPEATRRAREHYLRRQLAAVNEELVRIAMSRDTGGPYLDRIGVDMLVVDEAHRYKHLGIAGGMRLSGMPSKPSKMAENLKRLCDHLRDQGKGSNIVFLTGTPVTNSVCELYVMQSYLAPKALEDVNITSFNGWAATFGEVHREVEVKPEGGLQAKDRFSRFTNLPELMAVVHGWCDLVTNDDLELELPDVKVVNVEVPPTAEQRQCMRWLEGRGEEIRHGRVDPKVDNMLVITNDGKKVALDPKLLFPDDDAVQPLRGGKVDRCAENVLDIYRRTTTAPDGEEVKGVQLVFCDQSTDNGQGWNVQADLRRRLVEMGIGENEVATVPGSLTPARRERLFEMARKGDIRVLIGSTQTLGTGVSVQERLAAIHDLDCPWRSSDLDQRLGRIKRQGNSFADCDWFKPIDYRYATVGTFDAYLYQTTARKGGFVSQVMTNDNPLREAAELSDVVLTLSEMKALASGNPAVRRRLELDNEVKSLQYKRSAWSREVDAAKERLEQEVRPAIKLLAEELVGSDALMEAARKVRSEGIELSEQNYTWHSITIDGKEYGTSQVDAAQANLELCKVFRSVGIGTTGREVARVGELSLCLGWEEGEDHPYMSVTCRDGASVETKGWIRYAEHVEPFIHGPVEQAFTLIESVIPTIRRTRRTYARLRGEEADLVAQTEGATWPLEEELTRKRTELEALPLEDGDALSRARSYPHITDVYAMLTQGRVVATDTRRQVDGNRQEAEAPRLVARR